MQNFGVTKKEHYGMLWYFLEWSNMARSFEAVCMTGFAHQKKLCKLG